MPTTQTSDDLSSEKLLPLVYEELRRLATSRMARESAGMTLQPTALVHEAWLRLKGANKPNWSNRVHFFRAAARAMRQILVDHARHKATLKHGHKLDLDVGSLSLVVATPDERLLLIDECLQQFEHSDPASAQIVMLKFFAGLTNKEVSDDLGIGVRSVERQWAYAKAKLFKLISESDEKQEEAP